ncbi:MAG: hypothetical protein SF066_19900 [Thermoanaerobaculia bacterium]|nr:hypothetical protein [Thermoanaerobaculia bacterium]
MGLGPGHDSGELDQQTIEERVHWDDQRAITLLIEELEATNERDFEAPIAAHRLGAHLDEMGFFLR